MQFPPTFTQKLVSDSEYLAFSPIGTIIAPMPLNEEEIVA